MSFYAIIYKGISAMKIKRALATVLIVSTALFCVSCRKGGNTGSDSSGVTPSVGQTKQIDVMKDWKDLNDPREKFPPAGTQTGETSPRIVKTKYETRDIIVADIVPTEMGYAVDPTGVTDSTDGIQQALYDCYYGGGGTVFLPAGNYAITDTITIPQGVTLRGDWQDPDIGTEYGTVFSVWMDSSEEDAGGAFSIYDSAGIVGVTVYYPFQTLYEVLPYPFTFYVANTSQVITIRDITVINGYRGIGTSVEIPHEILIVDNFKGTFLKSGMELNNQSDAGTVESVKISSKYWKEASAEYMNAPVESEIDNYVKKNATGLIISDLEWTSFGDIAVDGYSIGIKIIPGYRINFAGSMLDVNITNCGIGLLAQGIDERWGMVMARSNIDGGIVNEWVGMIRTTDVKVSGNIEETREGTVELNIANLSKYTMDYTAYHAKPKANLIVAELKKGITTDVSAQLQSALNKAGEKGGGIVYVPGGTYRLDNPVTVPAGVELRGSSAVSQREIKKEGIMGTRFMCYYGDDASYNSETDRAFITLNGDNAGLSGIRILYPENGGNDEDLNTTYTVRGKGSGVYVVNTFIAASAYGVDFRNCDNHYLRGNYTCCYYNTYRVGGKNGMLRGCLHNPNMIGRTAAPGLVNWTDASRGLVQIGNPITRRYLQNLIIENAENECVYSVFGYACRNLIVNKNSNNTVVFNSGSDNLNALTAQLVNNGGSMAVINILRFNGHSCDNLKGSVLLYNRIAFYEADLEENEILAGGIS